MLKNIVKSCLITAMVCSMSAPVIAADVAATVNGRTRTWLENTAVKDGAKTMQFKADGRLGASVSAKSGAWTATAFQNMDLDSDAGTASPTIREQKISLENDAVSVTIGRFSPYGVSKGMAYVYGATYDSYWAGENMLTTDIADHLTVGLKDVGLTLIVGMNNYRADVSDPVDGTVDPYNETVMGASFSKAFGPLDLAVQYATAQTKIDDKDSDYDATGDAGKDSFWDGASYTNAALGVGFAINDKMGVAFNYEATNKKSGVSGADAIKTSVMELWFDVGLDDTMGISIGYGMKQTKDSSSKKTNATMTNATFSKTLGIAALYLSYQATTEKDDDIVVATGKKTDAGTSATAAGIEISF